MRPPSSRAAFSAALLTTLFVALGCDPRVTPHDLPPDMAPDLATPLYTCPPCKTGEICVQSYDGTCTTSGPRCVPTTACTPGRCDEACYREVCGRSPLHPPCHGGPACGSEAPGSIDCYGY